MALQPQHGCGVDGAQALGHAAGLPDQLQQPVCDPLALALRQLELLGDLLHLILPAPWGGSVEICCSARYMKGPKLA